MQTGLLGALIFFGFALTLPASPGGPKPKRIVTDHFDGVRFHNRAPYTPDNFRDSVKLFWAIAVHRHRWPRQPAVQQQATPAEARVPCGVRATVIGHATVLLQVDGLNILTDPVMEDRIGANRLLSVKRQMAPGLSLEQLPVIDVILLSHNHFDHLDIPSLQAIVKRQPDHAPLVLTGLGNADLLQKHGIPHVQEMDWGDSLEVSGERIDFLEAVHESGRFNYVDDKSLWGLSLSKLPARRSTLQGIRPTAITSSESETHSVRSICRFSRLGLTNLMLFYTATIWTRQRQFRCISISGARKALAFISMSSTPQPTGSISR